MQVLSLKKGGRYFQILQMPGEAFNHLRGFVGTTLVSPVHMRLTPAALPHLQEPGVDPHRQERLLTLLRVCNVPGPGLSTSL